MTSREDYERRLRKAEAWFSVVQDVISDENSGEFQKRYGELADEAHAAFQGIESRCFEFGPDERLHFCLKYSWRRV